MKVIITGGTGFIGLTLSTKLIRDGHDVIVLSRYPIANKDRVPGASIIGWDGRTPLGWAHLIEGADAVVNLAGQDVSGYKFFPNRWTLDRKREIRDSRLHAGHAVTQAVKLAKVKPGVVIQSSGVSIYGDTGDKLISEEHPAGEDFLSRLAVEWENSTRAVESLGVRQVIIRSAVNLSTESGALPRLLLPFKLFAGGPMGTGRQYLPWIHPQDEVAAIRFLINNKRAHGAFNLVAPQNVTNATFGKTLARLLKRPYWIPVPGFALRLAFGEVVKTVLTGQRAVPMRLEQMGFKFLYPELEPALRNILQTPKESS